MLNKVMIIGRLGADPDLRYSQSGTPMCSLRVATDDSYTDRDGNRQDRTEWHRVVVFQKQAESCNTYLKKGSLVYVEGSLHTRQWQDKEGQDRYTTEITASRVVFLDRRNAGTDGGESPQPAPSYQSTPAETAKVPAKTSRAKSSAPKKTVEEDMGTPFPSEAGQMDDLPF